MNNNLRSFLKILKGNQHKRQKCIQFSRQNLLHI